MENVPVIDLGKVPVGVYKTLMDGLDLGEKQLIREYEQFDGYLIRNNNETSSKALEIVIAQIKGLIATYRYFNRNATACRLEVKLAELQLNSQKARWQEPTE
jgi:hypothetical protein